MLISPHRLALRQMTYRFLNNIFFCKMDVDFFFKQKEILKRFTHFWSLLPKIITKDSKPVLTERLTLKNVSEFMVHLISKQSAEMREMTPCTRSRSLWCSQITPE